MLHIPVTTNNKPSKLYFEKFTHFFEEPGHVWTVNIGKARYDKRPLNQPEIMQLKERLAELDCNGRIKEFGQGFRAIIFDHDADNALFLFYVYSGLIN